MVKLTIKMHVADILHEIKPTAIVIGAGDVDENTWSSAGILQKNMHVEAIIQMTMNSISFQTLK